MKLNARTHTTVVASWVGLIATGAGFFVWFLGFDYLWAIAIVLSMGCVAGAAIANLRFDEAVSPDPVAPEIQRGVRFDVATIAESLAACDRLARRPVVRRIRALLISERDDRLARSRVLHRTQWLLSTELSCRGLDSGNPSHVEAIIALLGADATAIFRPDDRTPVTTATVEKCLDAVEHLGTETI